MIESGRRSVTDRGTLARIASTLAIPPHVLGIAGSGLSDPWLGPCDDAEMRHS